MEFIPHFTDRDDYKSEKHEQLAAWNFYFYDLKKPDRPVVFQCSADKLEEAQAMVIDQTDFSLDQLGCTTILNTNDEFTK